MAEDIRYGIVEQHPARIWVAHPALEPITVDYGGTTVEIALTRQELLDFLPKPPAQTKEVRYVTSVLLNVRSGPGVSFPVVGQLTKGAVIAVTQTANADTYVWRKLDSPEAQWIAEIFTTATPPAPPPPVVETLRVIAPDGLTVRAAPGVTQPKLRALQVGTLVKVSASQEKDDLTWRQLVEDSAPGWVAAKYLGNPNQPNPPSTTYKSWIGLHSCSGWVRPEFLPAIQAAHQQGTPVRGVTLVFNWWLGKPIKDISPETKVAVRNWPDGSPPVLDPDGWFFHQYGAMSDIEGVDYFIMTNEWGDWSGPESVAQIARFWQRMIELAILKGIKITMLDLAVGWLEPWAFEIIKPVLQFGADNGMPLNYHAYADLNNVYSPLSAWEFNTGRAWKWMEEIPNLLLWGGEAGPPEWKDKDGVDAHFRSSEDFGRICWETDEVVLKASSDVQARVLALCYWATNTDPRWETFEIAPALGDGTLLSYQKSRMT